MKDSGDGMGSCLNVCLASCVSCFENRFFGDG